MEWKYRVFGVKWSALWGKEVSLIKTITRVELRRLAQIFIREVKVCKDGNLVNPENVPIIVRLARARKMIEMLSSGTYRTKQEIGDMFGMSQAQVSRLCRSAFLSPVIVERLRIRNSRRPTSSTAHCRSRASRLSPTSSSHFPSGPSNTRSLGLNKENSKKTDKYLI